MMRREWLTGKGIQFALMCGMLIAVVVGGVKSAGHDFPMVENTDVIEVSEGVAESVLKDSPEMESAGQMALDKRGADEATLYTEDLGAGMERATLSQDEPAVEIQGNVLTYGSLRVTLPEGIEAKPMEAQDNGNLFDTGHFLSDGSKGRILDLCGAQDVYADEVKREYAYRLEQ